MTQSQHSYLVGLIGSGIGPSLSPALHEREADRHGLRYLYRLLDIDRLGIPPAGAGRCRASTTPVHRIDETYRAMHTHAYQRMHCEEKTRDRARRTRLFGRP